MTNMSHKKEACFSGVFFVDTLSAGSSIFKAHSANCFSTVSLNWDKHLSVTTRLILAWASCAHSDCWEFWNWYVLCRTYDDNSSLCWGRWITWPCFFHYLYYSSSSSGKVYPAYSSSTFTSYSDVVLALCITCWWFFNGESCARIYKMKTKK